MKTKLTTLAAMFGLALTAAAQSSAGSSGTSRIGGVAGSDPTVAPIDQRDPSAAAAASQAQMFRQLDANSDGSLSREEFARLPILSDMEGQSASVRSATTTTTTTAAPTTTVRTSGIPSSAVIKGATTTTLTTTSSSGEPNSTTRPTTTTTPRNSGVSGAPVVSPGTGPLSGETTPNGIRTGSGSGAGVVPR